MHIGGAISATRNAYHWPVLVNMSAKNNYQAEIEASGSRRRRAVGQRRGERRGERRGQTRGREVYLLSARIPRSFLLILGFGLLARNLARARRY